ncbi:YIP1 family protein, partial [Paludifilum halophilum]|uniref:YIP1 family protein n=1 Tax=Paludifilum halophilum TaxID=1642702 RepID=UPI00146E301D
ILVPTWVSLFGISFTLDQISFSEYGDWYSLSYLLLISLPIGIAVGFAVWLLYGVLFWGVGKLFGGQATWQEMQGAVAWAMIPYIAKLILWYLRALFFQEETFTLYTPTIENSLLLLFLYFFFLVLDVLFTLWFYGILFKSVAEAHRFSFWKGAPVVLISIAVLWVALKYGANLVIMPL